MRYPRTQRCARWAASRRLLWPVGSLMPASSGAERLQKGVEGKGAHVRSRAQGARDVQAVRDEGNRDGAGTVSAAGEFLTREFSASVADGSSPAGSDLLGSQVHSLVYVPRDAAAGRVRAPLVVCCHGLGESGLRVAGIAQRFATAGAVAAVPSFRSQINDPVCAFDDIQVMLNNDNGIAFIDKPLQQYLMASNASMLEHNHWGLADLSRACLGVRVYGSAGISFGKTLSGGLAAYFSYNWPWDYAAAYVMADKLGFVIQTLDGGQPNFQTKEPIMIAPKCKLGELQEYLRKGKG